MDVWRFPVLATATVVIAWLAWLPVFAGASGAPPPDEDLLPVNLPRTQAQSRDGVTVRVTIPPGAAAAQIFGAPMAEHGIQPVWIHIENDSEFDYWLMNIALDPDYYSPDEAALVAGAKLGKEERARLTATLRAKAMPRFQGRHTANEGYVYASYLRGGRFVDVLLSGPGRTPRFRFAVLLPTQGFDYERSELRNLYQKLGEYPDVSLEELRVRIRELPCCTSDSSGKGQGDPLNVALVGTGEDAISALISSGWNLTEAITAESVRKMVGAAIAENSYLTAPVSSLYLFGRKQDVALQRGRSTINQRNHMRLWLAPFRYQGLPVWGGQVSRDIGVKLTSKSPTLTTHIIDPVVDESREYLLQSLVYREAGSQFAFVRGVGAASIEQPRHNLVGDPYITDGNRLLLFLSREPVALHDVRNLNWNESTDAILEGKGENPVVPEHL
jgi:hypothetical protein